MKKVWFKAKTYGWGWYPASWQGWLIMLAYVIGLVKIFLIIDYRSPSTSDTLVQFALPFVCLTILLLVICYTKGERPRWRWGKDT